VYYWMSFAMQRGFELLGGRISSCSGKVPKIVSVTNAVHNTKSLS
jgi:hypothetical protein